MMNKKYLIGLFLLVLSVAVFAYTVTRQIQVRTCTDSDGGLNFLVAGNITGYNLNNTYYSRSDYCLNNATVMEYSCSVIGNVTYAVEGYENCTAINMTSCSFSRCI